MTPPRALALVAILTVLLLPASAPAEDGRPRDNALSVPIIGLLVSSLGVQYERRIVDQWSVATSMAIRRSGGEDFDVTETGFGVEGRHWLFRRQHRFVRGPYFAARFEFGTTRVAQHDRLIGTSVRFGESVSSGWRWVFGDRYEVTPAVGLGARTEIDGRARLATWTRPEIFRLAVTAGVVF